MKTIKSVIIIGICLCSLKLYTGKPCPKRIFPTAPLHIEHIAPTCKTDSDCFKEKARGGKCSIQLSAEHPKLKVSHCMCTGRIDCKSRDNVCGWTKTAKGGIPVPGCIPMARTPSKLQPELGDSK